MTSNDYAYYDRLRLELNATTAIPLVNNGNSDDDDANGRNLHLVLDIDEILCHIPIMFRWTSGSGDTVADVSSEAYGGSVAAALAIHHFNTQNPTIVDEVSSSLTESCPIKLTFELLNSQSSGQAAMQQLTRLLTRSPNNIASPQPCALLGSSWSSVTKKMATVTGVYDLPHITSSASSVELDNAGEYPLFTRTHPSDASMARLSIDYLHTQLGIQFVGVLYLDNAFGNSYNEVLLEAANDYNMTIVSESFRAGATDEEVRTALERLAATEYRYFLGVFFGGDYERVMTMAYELGIVGNSGTGDSSSSSSYFWMFNGALASKFVNGVTSLPKDSPAAKATYGNAILTDEGGLPGVDIRHDRFLQAWRSIPDEFLDYIHSKQPKTIDNNGDNDTTTIINFNRTRDFFTNLAPSHIAAFSYDAVMSLGLAACSAYAEQEKQQAIENGDSTSSKTTIFSGAMHHSKMTTQTFLGASGNVKIGPDTFSRTAESTVHVVFNILPTEEDTDNNDNNEELINFQGTPLSVFDTSTQEWVAYSNNAFVYADGTTTPPQQIPQLDADMNAISPAVRATCLTLSGLAILLSIGCYVYCCVVQRQHRVIRASQPFFLGMICAGTLLMASSIIPASMDDTIISEMGCNIACVAQFWLFPIGFCLVFAALFSKLWRINILLSQSTRFQRIQVETRDVMIPFCVLLGSNVAILTAWTIVDPPYWSREAMEYDDFGRINESTGQCASDSMVAFLSPLLAINGSALLLALWQAYVCRNVSTDFSESKYIAMATVCIFQALFMGVPIIFIVEDQPGALLFVYTGVVVVVCFSILLLMFIPKIQAIHSKEHAIARPAFVGASSNMGAAAAMAGGGTRISMAGETFNNNSRQPDTLANWPALGGYPTNSTDSVQLESVMEVDEVVKPALHSFSGGSSESHPKSSGISSRPESAADD